MRVCYIELILYLSSYKQYVLMPEASANMSMLILLFAPRLLSGLPLDSMQDVEGMMSISVEAAEAEDSLSDDREIVSTYEVELNSLSF